MSRRVSVWIERSLLVIGMACLGTYAFVTLDARRFQAEKRTEFEVGETTAGSPAATASGTLSAPLASDRPPNESVATGTMLGMLSVPRLGLSTPVVHGDDDATLGNAVGHLPDTPLPWEPGNSAVAAHRDTLFRPLKDIAVGDEIRFRTLQGEFLYRVTRTVIVNPDELWVLDTGPRDMLTLITCHPFYYVGHAPHRFIVQAERD
jgi:sortase A